MTLPPFAPPGVLRLDAAMVPDDDPDGPGLLVRLRSASAMGLPLFPFVVVDSGPAQKHDDVDPFPPYPVAAVSAADPVVGVDVSGYRTASTEGPHFAVAGSPLVGEARPDAQGWQVFPQLRWHEDSRRDTTVLRAPLLEPWHGRWDESDVVNRVQVTDPESVREFLARPELRPRFGPSPADPLDRAWAQVDPWRPAFWDLLAAHGHENLAGAVLIDDTDPGQGSVVLDLGVWWAASTVDPAVAALAGMLARLSVPDDDRDGVGYLEQLTALGVFAVPANYVEGPEHDPPSWALARAYADDDQPRQDDVHQRLDEVFGGIGERLDEVSPRLRVVFVATGAIAVPLPDLPRRPVLAPDPSGSDATSSVVRISGHQTGGVALSRTDGVEVREENLLLPEPGRVEDVWSTATVPPTPVEYRGWTQDAWGRWSERSDAVCDRPEPPVQPPRPQLEVLPADVSSLPGSGPASPGRVRVRAVVAAPRPGGRTVDAVTCSVTGGAGPGALTPITDPYVVPGEAGGEWWETAIDADPTEPGGGVTVEVRAFSHAGPLQAGSTLHSVRVADPRPVPFVARSAVLHRAGAIAADGRAEVDLRLARPLVPAGTRFRVYVSDEAALAPGLTATKPARHDRVADLVARVGNRSAFVRLDDGHLTEVPDVPGHTALRLRLAVPGRGESLRVVQVVAVTATGAETPASAAGGFVVGARLSDTPASPVLVPSRSDPVKVTVTEPRGSSVPLALRRRGLDPSASLPAEVWWAPDGPIASPSRAVRAASLTLEPAHPGPGRPWTWTGWATDLSVPAGVPPYTPLRLWARAAWPDEPGWRPGTFPVPGEVATYDPKPPPSWPVTPSTVPSAWSRFSPGVRVVAPGYPSDPWCGASPVSSPPVLHLYFPDLAPAALPWRVRVGAPGVTPMSLSSRGEDVTVSNFPGWPPDRTTWRVVFTAPDGAAGRVFNGLGAQLS